MVQRSKCGVEVLSAVNGEMLLSVWQRFSALIVMSRGGGVRNCECLVVSLDELYVYIDELNVCETVC